MFLKRSRKVLAMAAVVCCLSGSVFAAEAPDLEKAIREQQAVLEKLNVQKQQAEVVEQRRQQQELVVAVRVLQEQQEKQRKMQEGINTTLESVQRFLSSKNDGTGSAELVQALAAVQQQQAEQQTMLRELRAMVNQKVSAAEDANVVQIREEMNRQREVLLSVQRSLENGRQSAYSPALTTAVTPSKVDVSSYGNTQDSAGAERDAEVNFNYIEGSIYKINCKVGFLTDIKFHKGEKVTFVGGGDTSKWSIDTTNTGSGADAVAHLYIKPLKKETDTNLIVNTDRHTYQIIITSAESYNPMVTWSYGAEEQLAGKIQKQKDENLFTERNLNAFTPEKMNYGYQVKNDKDFSWAPTIVFDDGAKTFIKMPENVSQGNMPVLFIKEKGNRKKLALVNYRVKDGFYIVDRLFDEAELRVSEKEFVRIKSSK